MKRDFTPFDIVGPAILEFTSRWNKAKLGDIDLSYLIKYAIEPRMTDATTFAACYVKAPDYTVAVLALVRKIWFKDSLRQRLKVYLVTHSTRYRGDVEGDAVPVAVGHNRNGKRWTMHTRHQKVKCISDREIAEAYNADIGRRHRESASMKDVEQARRALVPAAR